ncbi:MAG: hypothetical protein QOI64_2014 [Solirubrobacteraceae bacterium]|nr:hypothetical protein [Solirubrobacteraceae bacterium]
MSRVLPCLVALLALLLGCGGDASEPPSRPLGTGGLARALELARADGREPMHLKATTTRPGRGTRPQFDAQGELDLGAAAGRATLHLDGFGMRDLTIDWTAAGVEVGGKALSRERARADGGQLGLLPDETQGLAELVADADDVRERGNGHWMFTVAPAAAVRRGIPPQPESGNAWRGEAWAAADGRLRRVRIELPTPALGATIPAGVATLELELG